ncbi:MAG TPA: outer membrane lipid asymmetry maintenance protein MlaD [Gammaproteobacteria bacterium]|nr:outer membrane lipid asymmetry maintenance protein MlaD [Gammaproteobacteria bacterium]
MRQTKAVEIGVGLFVAAGLIALFVMAIKMSNFSSFDNGAGYDVTARFDNIGGLKERSPVSMAGVKVGQVSSIALDSQTYEAVVTLTINSQYAALPLDTSASIFTAGLLGEQYIALEPGGEETYLANGSELQLTQSALVLEQLIGQFLFNAGGDDE